MTAATKKACVGTVFEQYISAAYVAVAQVKEVSLDDVGGKSIEVKSLDSPADGNSVVWADKIWDGIADPGSASFTIFLDPASTSHQAIISSNFASTQWKTVYANSGGAYDGFTSSTSTCSRKISVGEAMMMDVKLELSGPVTQF